MAAVPPTKSADEKLRTVLDYNPCEACLAEPSPEHELLCSVCRRLDRQVAVKFVTRTSVILDRPAPAAAEMVAIPPAPTPEPEPVAATRIPALEVIFRRRSFLPTRRSSAAVEVIVEPYEEPAPDALPVVPAVAEAPVEPRPEPEEAFVWDDLASYDGRREEEDSIYSWSGTAESRVKEAEAPAKIRQPEQSPVPEPEPAEDLPEDDFVFRPPASSEPEQAPAEEEDAWMPAEEIPLEPPVDRDPWAPPQEAEPESAGWTPSVEEDQEEEVDLEILEDEEDLVEMEILEEEPEPAQPSLFSAPYAPSRIIGEPGRVTDLPLREEEERFAADHQPKAETSSSANPEPVAEPTPEPTAVEAPVPTPTSEPEDRDDSDLWRLPGFTGAARAAFKAAGIDTLSHLSGHDSVELAGRIDVARETLKPWIAVADLAQEAGIPIDGALTLVAAGIEGPGGLAALEVDQVVAQVEESGGSVSARDVKRWKRRV